MLLFRRGLNKKVDFIICGVQKAGTTALDAYLREHPDICMAQRKEVHFFDDEEAFRNGNEDYELYHSYFGHCSQAMLVGEATPIYSYWKQAPQRIQKYNPLMKLILVLRNPIERAYSHWNMEYSRGAETLSFSDAIRNESERCKAAHPFQHTVFSYTDRGFYTVQLRRLYKLFPAAQLLILKNEELRNNPNKVLNKVYEFLGVRRQGGVEHKDVHSRPYRVPIDDCDKAFLLEHFKDEIRELELMLGWDCKSWLN
jgi:hypothetical protein